MRKAVVSSRCFVQRKKYDSRESNPGQSNGNALCYPYTTIVSVLRRTNLHIYTIYITAFHTILIFINTCQPHCITSNIVIHCDPQSLPFFNKYHSSLTFITFHSPKHTENKQNSMHPTKTFATNFRPASGNTSSSFIPFTLTSSKLAHDHSILLIFNIYYLDSKAG